jgi:autotransporter-associated beta strand protein
MNTSALVKYPNIVFRRVLPAVIVAVLGIAGSAKAAAIYWDGGTIATNSGLAWGTAANWSTSSSATTPDPSAAPTNTDDVIFSITPSNVVSCNLYLGADQAAKSLTFNSAYPYSAFLNPFVGSPTGIQIFGNAPGSGTATHNLTVGTGGITMNPGANPVVIGQTNITYGNVSIMLAGSQTWVNNSVNKFTLMASNASPATTALTIAGGQTLTFDGTGTFQIGSATTTFTQLGNLSGSGNIVRTGAGGMLGTGAVQLNGTNTSFTGAVTVNSGIFQIGNSNALGNASSLTINGGWLDASGVALGASKFSVPENWNGDFGYFGSGGTLNMGTWPVTLGGTRQLSVASTLTIGGVIGDNSHNYGLIKLGNGTLTLNGASTYSGTTTIGAGTLQLGLAVGGSLPSTAALVFNGSSSLFNDNASGTNSVSQTFASLTFSSGEGVVQNNASATKTNLLTFNSLTRSTGATAGFAINGGVAGATNIINLPNANLGFIDQGTFVESGNSWTANSAAQFYAWVDSKTLSGPFLTGTYKYIRPILWASDAACAVTAPTNSYNNAGVDHLLVMGAAPSGVLTNQTTATFKTLTVSNSSGTANITLASGATLTVNGLIRAGAFQSTPIIISGGNGIQADLNQEFIVRPLGNSDNVVFSTPILQNGVNPFVLCGKVATFDAPNTYTGDTYVNGGTLNLDPSAGSAGGGPGGPGTGWTGFAVDGITGLGISSLHLAAGATLSAQVYYPAGANLDLGSDQLSSIVLNGSWGGTSGVGSPQGTKSTIQAPVGGSIDFNSTHIIMNYDGSPSPVLFTGLNAQLTNQILYFANNRFTINNNSYLPDGAYTLVTNVGWYGGQTNIQPSPSTNSFGTFTVDGTAINPAKAGRTAIVVSGTRVLLTINAPVFSNLSGGNQTITHGAIGSLTLSGKLSDNSGASPVYPAAGEKIYVTIGNITQTTTINDNTGDFSLNFDTSKVQGGINQISYSYLGNPSIPLAATSDSSTYLIVNQVPCNMVLTSSANPAHGQSLFFTATLPADAIGSGNGSGMIFYTNIVGAVSNKLGSAVTVTGSGGTIISASTPKLVFGPVPCNVQITAAWPGDVSYIGSTNTITIVVNADQPPVANSTNYTRSAGVYQLDIPTNSLLSNALDPDGDALTLTVGASTNGVTPIINNGNVVYYNTNNVADKFTYIVNDGLGKTATNFVYVNLDTTSVFGQTSPSIDTTGGAPTLTFAGIPGYSYSVVRATDASFTQNVTTVLTTNTPAGGVFQFTDNNPPTPMAFYRLQWNP